MNFKKVPWGLFDYIASVLVSAPKVKHDIGMIRAGVKALGWRSRGKTPTSARVSIAVYEMAIRGRIMRPSKGIYLAASKRAA
jgi:hypothetical protein